MEAPGESVETQEEPPVLVVSKSCDLESFEEEVENLSWKESFDADDVIMEPDVENEEEDEIFLEDL